MAEYKGKVLLIVNVASKVRAVFHGRGAWA